MTGATSVVANSVLRYFVLVGGEIKMSPLWVSFQLLLVKLQGAAVQPPMLFWRLGLKLTPEHRNLRYERHEKVRAMENWCWHPLRIFRNGKSIKLATSVFRQA